MAIQDQNPFGPQSREPTAVPEMGDAVEVVIREPGVKVRARDKGRSRASRPANGAVGGGGGVPALLVSSQAV